MLQNRVSRAAMAFLTRSTTILAILAFAEHSFGAQFSTWQSSDYAILMEANSSLTVSGTSPTDKIFGNVGFGDTTATSGGGTLTGTGATGATISGHQPGNIASSISAVDFAATSSQTYTQGSLTVTPSATAATGVSQVTTALAQLNTISTGENITGYSTTISAGTTLNLTGVTANDGGDIVYNATIASNMSTSFGGIFDILGSSTQTVIFNITGSPTLEGVINLGGPTNQGHAILSPNVIFNFTTANNTFTMNTDRSANNLDTQGIYLDQAGKFAVTNSRIFGLLVGDGASTFNTSEIYFTPEPSGLVLAALGIVCLGGAGWRKAKRQQRGKIG